MADVFRTPDENIFTDPWRVVVLLTLPAAAVVLEVGGVLQHGAVVAREYGKPCVAGIDRVMTKLDDGQRVEVDGTAGVIRLLDTCDRGNLG